MISIAACIALGKSLDSVRVGLLSGLICAVLPVTMFHDRQVLVDPLKAAFTTLCILLIVWMAKKPRIWQGLPREAREAQLDHMISLTEELYPTFRWFFYDGLERYSVPLTIFGPMRASIYLGQRFLVLNSRELIQMLIGHFDNLIRDAVVQPTDLPARMRELREEIC